MTENGTKKRLITRDDLDGVVCGSLLTEKGLVDSVVFAHPRDIESGAFTVMPTDVIANLPYKDQAHLCFTHHEHSRNAGNENDNFITDYNASSTARVIYNYYGGAPTFPEISEDMLLAVDKAGSADYNIEEILIPSDWMLLSFVLDPRTGLETFKEFSLPHNAFLLDLIAFCKRSPIHEILTHPDVEERVNTFLFQAEFAELQLSRCAEVHGKTVVVDMHNEEKRYPGNRFLIYGLFPECSLSIQLLATKTTGLTEISMGKSIIDRSSPINVGELLAQYGGGGHAAAGTCRIGNDKLELVVSEILAQIG